MCAISPDFAAILWLRNFQYKQQNFEVFEASSPDVELSKFHVLPQSIDLKIIIINALHLVQNLAVQKQITINRELPLDPVEILSDQTMAQQAIVSLLSYMIREVAPQ